MLDGAYVANLTPFRDDLAVDEDAYLRHVDFLGEAGIDGIVAFGTNGEGPSLTLEEADNLLSRILRAAHPMRVVPSVMRGNLPDTLRALERINDTAAEAVLVLPPYYFKPASADGLKAFFEAVITTSRLPVIAYHIPKYAVPIPESVINELPLWGAKDSGGDESYTQTLVQNGKGVLVGTEDNLAGRLSLGPSGIVSALGNFIPEKVVELMRYHRNGNDAQVVALAAQLQEVRRLVKQHPSPSILKRLAERRHGTSMGRVRPPLIEIRSSASLTPVLSAAGVG